MITKFQYFRNKPYPPQHGVNADNMLRALNGFLFEAAGDGAYDYWVDEDTNSQISGVHGGNGDGGYRSPDSTTGVGGSNHKKALATDVHDLARKLAAYCVAHPEKLEKYCLYIEDPRWTPTWVHFQWIAPGSGHRIYIPSITPPLAPPLPTRKDGE